MTLRELREHLYDIVIAYFKGLEPNGVVWAGSNSVKATPPFVTLKTGAVTQTTFGNVRCDGGVSSTEYNMKTILEVQLFTPGGEREHGEGEALAMENTAVSDLIDFVNYMKSDYVSGITEGLNITLIPMGQVQDLSALLNDVSFEYRAMVEFQVNFVQTATGAAGISTPGWKPTPSGGGSAELAAKEIGYFDEVAIKEEKI